jgi:hypothetical protein
LQQTSKLVIKSFESFFGKIKSGFSKTFRSLLHHSFGKEVYCNHHQFFRVNVPLFKSSFPQGNPIGFKYFSQRSCSQFVLLAYLKTKKEDTFKLFTKSNNFIICVEIPSIFPRILICFIQLGGG